MAELFRDVLFEPAFQNRFRAVTFAILEKSGPQSGVHGKFAPFYQIFGRYGSAQVSLKAPEIKEKAPDVSVYEVGQIVIHDKFGRGTVMGLQLDMGRITVDFSDFGVKTLAVDKAKLTIVGKS